MRVDFDAPPYDQGSIQDAYSQGQGTAVGEHFAEIPLVEGDCIVIDGDAYRITAVRVVCDEHVVYENGAPPPEDPDLVHDYGGPDVQVMLWLEPIPLEECP